MNEFKKKDINILSFLYIISAAIAFISKIGYITPKPYIQYSIFSFWIIMAILKWSKNRFNIKNINKNIRFLFLFFLVPRIIIHVYSLILYLFNQVDYITRNTQTYLIVFSVFSIIYLFERKALKYTINAAVVACIIIISYNITVYGIATIPQTLISLFSDNYRAIAGIYEVNDLTFAIGYLLLYFILVKEKFTLRDLAYVYFFSIFILLGLKRIQIAAIISMIIYVVFTKFIKNKYSFYKLTSWIYIIVAYIFIWSLSNSLLWDFIGKIGLNVMGRNFFYNAIISIADFSVAFFGFGRNYVPHLLSSQYSYLNVGGVHSDVLKYYVECGFILFGIWMWFNLVKAINIFKSKYSFKVTKTYYVLTLYTFILYYTDNVDTYFITQFMYILIIVVMAINDEYITRENIESKNEG